MITKPNRRALLTTAAGVAASAAVPVSSIAAPIGVGGDGPAAASPLPEDPSSAAATLARFNDAMEILRTCHVCEGWTLNEAGAARALRYFERTETPALREDEDDAEEAAAIDFLSHHGLSLDWIFCGDAGAMIAARAAASLRAQSASAQSDPIFAAIEAHRSAISDAALERDRMWDLVWTVPTTAHGLAALLGYCRENESINELVHRDEWEDVLEWTIECAVCALASMPAPPMGDVIAEMSKEKNRDAAWDALEDISTRH